MLGAGALGGGDDEAVVVVRVDEVGDDRFTGRADESVAHLVVVARHVAAGGPGDAVRELQLRGDPFIDARMALPLAAGRADQGRLAAAERGQDTHGVQAVAAEVHEGTSAELE